MTRQFGEITYTGMDAKDLESLFVALGIDYTSVGFYDQKAFTTVEESDPRFLETYAMFVCLRPYSDEYLARARSEVPRICDALFKELTTDGRMGACVDMSMVLSRILENEGFWNYVVKGSLTISFPMNSGLTPRYFWPVDDGSREFAAAHVWVVAPPYMILDLTCKQQPWAKNEQDWLDDFVCEENYKSSNVENIDIVSPGVSRILKSEGLSDKIQDLKPEFREFSKKFPPVEISQANATLKYVPMGISASDHPLHKIVTLQLNGQSGNQIYKRVIIPFLKQLRYPSKTAQAPKQKTD